MVRASLYFIAFSSAYAFTSDPPFEFSPCDDAGGVPNFVGAYEIADLEISGSVTQSFTVSDPKGTSSVIANAIVDGVVIDSGKLNTFDDDVNNPFVTCVTIPANGEISFRASTTGTIGSNLFHYFVSEGTNACSDLST